MTLPNTIIVGLKEVWTHKFRSLLTMLGIILGVASLVGMAAIIKGMENGMRETMVANGKTPALAIAVHVEEAFFHCAKCIIRSHLWQPERWPSIEGLATLAETMKDAASIPGPVEVLEGIIKEDEENRLY